MVKKKVKKRSKKKCMSLKETKAYQHTLELKKNLRAHSVTALVAAFGFVIALYWRDIINEGVQKIIAATNLTGGGFIIKIVAAILVTVVCIFGIFIVSKWEIKEED
ncbi:hypothetical protein HN592_05415 [Candidatus Woesearchaeota archaeon]|jgi:hypothetical protein|nr:hypothetical protein [Candidatus Woesearchaeota archaeon]MBT4367965.1 hypothetical protein [Candidatus Woesearchaeota archaeon]MBT4712453.1 hypothetical protein [Candidatus Woesearchaeota archaeon]MBT6639366.1 hypothetical protein [Candidatus Woesearchaeota archaeon]MBT7133538.1 hypothetical protein [Candidatus Woesearchaeota archaeon]